MPTLRELRPAKSRSAVSRTIACRSARLRRTGPPASAARASSAAARDRAEVTVPMVHPGVTEQFAARRRMLLWVTRGVRVTRGTGGRWCRCDDGASPDDSVAADAAGVGQHAPDDGGRRLRAARLLGLRRRVVVVHTGFVLGVGHATSLPCARCGETAPNR